MENEIKLPFDTSIVDKEIVKVEMKDFDIIRNSIDGFGCDVYFKNKYIASIVKHKRSYGYNEGLYEIAVMNEKHNIVYDTQVTEDVLGYVDVKDIPKYLKQISELPERNCQL